MSGWLKIHRKITKWEWYKESYMVHLMIHLVACAYWEDTNFKGVSYRRGQFPTGRKKLNAETGITEQKLRTGLKRLEASGEISIKVTSKFSIITICNYEEYQSLDQVDNQQVTSNQPAINQEITSDQPADNQQVTTVKEVKKLKEVKEVKNINGASVGGIFDFWNSKGVIVHKNIKPFHKHINAKLEDGYSEYEIKEAIENYKAILFGGQYFWTHKYGLKEFLTRAGNLDRFLSVNNPFDSFKIEKKPNKKSGGTGYVEATPGKNYTL
jgi:predicted transcriptional regulator